MTKIAEHNIQPYGTRGIALSLPKVYAADNEMRKGDIVMVFRTQINGIDALVLIPKSKEEQLGKFEKEQETVNA